MAFTRQVTLTEMECGQCGVMFAIPETMQAEKLRDGGSWWCPNGHGRHYAEPEVDRLRSQLKAAKAREVHERDQRRAAETARQAAERRAAAAWGQVTRLKNRAAAGVCPCCKRHFVNLERHMGSKHPDFTREEQ